MPKRWLKHDVYGRLGQSWIHKFRWTGQTIQLSHKPRWITSVCYKSWAWTCRECPRCTWERSNRLSNEVCRWHTSISLIWCLPSKGRHTTVRLAKWHFIFYHPKCMRRPLLSLDRCWWLVWTRSLSTNQSNNMSWVAILVRRLAHTWFTVHFINISHSI